MYLMELSPFQVTNDETPGILSESDLATYQVKTRETVSTTFHGKACSFFFLTNIMSAL